MKSYTKSLALVPNKESLDKIIQEIGRLTDIISEYHLLINYILLSTKEDDKEETDIRVERYKQKISSGEKSVEEYKKTRDEILNALGIKI